MARIFDNIDQDLLLALRATMQTSRGAGFCVGYAGNCDTKYQTGEAMEGDDD